MAHEEDNAPPPAELADRAWELAAKIKLAMYTTWTGTEPRGWPLGAHPKRNEEAIYFIVGAKGGKYDNLGQFPTVSLAFTDISDNRYVVITGQASISNDRERIKKYWNPVLKAWWDSPDDPDLRLLTVRTEKAELWDSPGKLQSYAIIIGAAVTGGKPPVGVHQKVEL